MKDREMWQSVFRDVWKVFRRYPFLAFWPLTLYMRVFEREKLDEMIEAARAQ